MSSERAGDASLRRVHDAVARALDRHVPPGQGVLVAWSGGVDSTSLWRATLAVGEAQGRAVAAAHVDHGLREGSAEDASWCAREAARHGAPLEIIRLSLGALFPKGGKSAQAQARAQRHAALARAALKAGVRHVLLAHHRDDALETAWMHGAQGTSARGLTSLAREVAPSPAADAPGVLLVRPLLHLGRADVEAYALHLSLRWREDPSNATDAYARNRTRHHLLGALDEDARQRLFETLLHLRDAADALEAARDATLREAMLDEPAPRALGLSREALLGCPEGVFAEALLWAGEQVGAGRLSRAHIMDARAYVHEARPGARLCLPGVVLTARADRLIVEGVEGQGTRALDTRQAHPVTIELSAPGALPWFDGVLRWSPSDGSRGERADTPGVLWWPLDGAETTRLVVRGPRAGERIVGARGEHLRISELLRAHGVPSDVRWRWPVLAREGGEAVWVCGVRAAPQPDAQREAVRVTWRTSEK